MIDLHVEMIIGYFWEKSLPEELGQFKLALKSYSNSTQKLRNW